MTLNEFIERLEKNQFVWAEVKKGVIRTTLDHHTHCPITAVTHDMIGTYFMPWNAKAAAELIGLPKQLANMIIAATDCHPRHDERIRKRLAKACFKREIGCE